MNYVLNFQALFDLNVEKCIYTFNYLINFQIFLILINFVIMYF